MSKKNTPYESDFLQSVSPHSFQEQLEMMETEIQQVSSRMQQVLGLSQQLFQTASDYLQSNSSETPNQESEAPNLEDKEGISSVVGSITSLSDVLTGQAEHTRHEFPHMMLNIEQQENIKHVDSTIQATIEKINKSIHQHQHILEQRVSDTNQQDQILQPSTLDHQLDQ